MRLENIDVFRADDGLINNTYNEGIALRSGPDVSYDLLTRVPYGTEVAVEAFSGGNSAPTTPGASWDYITIRDEATVTMTGCRMQGYKADTPLHVSPNAKLRALACIDRDNKFFEK